MQATMARLRAQLTELEVAEQKQPAMVAQEEEEPDELEFMLMAQLDRELEELGLRRVVRRQLFPEDERREDGLRRRASKSVEVEGAAYRHMRERMTYQAMVLTIAAGAITIGGLKAQRAIVSEDFVVLIGVEYLFGIGATICMWEEKVQYRLFVGIRTGLTAVLKVVAYVDKWILVESDIQAVKMAWCHADKLQKRYPHRLCSVSMEQSAQCGVCNIRQVDKDKIRQWGRIDVVIAGWECQGYSRAGAGRGMRDERSCLFRELVRVLKLIKRAQGDVLYIVENVDMEGDIREQVQVAQEEVTVALGPGVVADRAQAGSRTHRVRQYWTNGVSEATSRYRLSLMERSVPPGGRHTGAREDAGISGAARPPDAVSLQRSGEAEAGVADVCVRVEEEESQPRQEAGEKEWEIGKGMAEADVVELKKVLAKYRPAFAYSLKEVGRCNMVEVTLELTTDIPVYQMRRRMTAEETQICKEKCQGLLEAGFIWKSNSEYAAATVVATRTDLTGNVLSKRMCGDYRGMNKKKVMKRYQPPMPDEIFDKLAEALVFSTLYLRQGFNQIPIAEAGKGRQPSTSPMGSTSGTSCSLA
ncbi:unnamed protein product [Closterium sp. NIES-54]